MEVQKAEKPTCLYAMTVDNNGSIEALCHGKLSDITRCFYLPLGNTFEFVTVLYRACYEWGRSVNWIPTDWTPKMVQHGGHYKLESLLWYLSPKKHEAMFDQGWAETAKTVTLSFTLGEITHPTCFLVISGSNRFEGGLLHGRLIDLASILAEAMIREPEFAKAIWQPLYYWWLDAHFRTSQMFYMLIPEFMAKSMSVEEEYLTWIEDFRKSLTNKTGGL